METERKNAMNKEQLNAATEDMIEWLSHPAELGKAPAKIECAGEFDLYEMHYYIFKYKKSMLGKWLLGVCGGYEENELENCGHVFSEMEEYNEATAVEQATALVENVRQYYMDRENELEKRKENPGTFVNYVLLSEVKWDKASFLRDLNETWGIEDESPEDNDGDENDNTIVISYKGAMLAVSFMPAPIPNGEAEYSVARNFMWKDGTEQVKKHKAHILIAVIGKELSPVENGITLVKAVVSACKQEGVLGIYTGDIVYEPTYYLKFSESLKEDRFPISDLVWVGLYNSENGLCGYTAGMRNFGYDEMEVLDSGAEPIELLDLLTGIANYVITEDVILNEGETIGFTAEQKLPITKSRGVAVEGDSLKIEY
ncbi:MAG: DUF4261 domain-containing protein [Oscillospiraceae bacterium]|nr:DUF4261 domain-containing protein [Oscillospiraceae bacterium]